MNGLIALLGSGEYLPVMDETDRHLLANSGANGHTPRVVCLPTAAGEEGEESYGRWMRMGEEHFRTLGADVTAIPVIDRASADNPQHASLIENANVIYFSGGNPHYLYQTMSGSCVWEAAQKAWARGAVYAGCSAGAMILAHEIPDFRSAGLKTLRAFGTLTARTVFPHFDRFRVWRSMMLGILQTRLRKNEYALGIDEDTALVGRLGGAWTVMGRQQVHVITKGKMKSYSSGETVNLPA
jgi:cyanophycinase